MHVTLNIVLYRGPTTDLEHRIRAILSRQSACRALSGVTEISLTLAAGFRLFWDTSTSVQPMMTFNGSLARPSFQDLKSAPCSILLFPIDTLTHLIPVNRKWSLQSIRKAKGSTPPSTSSERIIDELSSSVRLSRSLRSPMDTTERTLQPFWKRPFLSNNSVPEMQPQQTATGSPVATKACGYQ